MVMMIVIVLASGGPGELNLVDSPDGGVRLEHINLHYSNLDTAIGAALSRQRLLLEPGNLPLAAVTVSAAQVIRQGELVGAAVAVRTTGPGSADLSIGGSEGGGTIQVAVADGAHVALGKSNGGSLALLLVAVVMAPGRRG